MGVLRSNGSLLLSTWPQSTLRSRNETVRLSVNSPDARVWSAPVDALAALIEAIEQMSSSEPMLSLWLLLVDCGARTWARAAGCRGWA